MNILGLSRTLTLVKRIMDPASPTQPMLDTKPDKPRLCAFVPMPEKTAPEEVGVESEHLAKFMKELADIPDVGIQSVSVYRNGRLLCSTAYGAWREDVWKNTFSECKSIVSLAIGMLIDEGKLALDTPIAQIFADKLSPLGKLKFKSFSVEGLLKMSSQISFNEAECLSNDDWVKGFLSASPHSQIGKGFNYNSLNTYMLSAIVSAVTQTSLSEYLDKKLFAPLGITNYYWEKCPRGQEKGGWGLYIAPADLAKIGQMVLNKGVYEGKRIISEEYISLATQKHNDPPATAGKFDYGYQIWVGRESDSFLFNGMLGQNLLAYRNNGIMIVSNAGNSDTFQTNPYFEVCDRYFNRDMAPSLPQNKRGLRTLRRTEKELSMHKYKKDELFTDKLTYPFKLRKFIAQINGSSYDTTSKNAASTGLCPLLMQAVQNTYTKGTKGYSFVGKKTDLTLIYKENEEDIHLQIGLKKPIYQNITLNGEHCYISCTGEIKKDEFDNTVLFVTVNFLEFPYTRYMRFYFKKDTLTVKYSETPGMELLVRSALLLPEFIRKTPFFASDNIPAKSKLCAVFEPELTSRFL